MFLSVGTLRRDDDDDSGVFAVVFRMRIKGIFLECDSQSV